MRRGQTATSLVRDLAVLLAQSEMLDSPAVSEVLARLRIDADRNHLDASDVQALDRALDRIGQRDQMAAKSSREGFRVDIRADIRAQIRAESRQVALTRARYITRDLGVLARQQPQPMRGAVTAPTVEDGASAPTITAPALATASRPSRVALSAHALAVILLSPRARARHEEELLDELYDLVESGASRRRQLACALRQVASTRQLRRLAESDSLQAAPGRD